MSANTHAPVRAWTRTLFLAIALSLLCLGLLFPSGGMAARSSQEELKAALQTLLREHPEIILDVLKDNSEMVLEIAQQGNMLRKRKAMIAQWKRDLTEPKKVALDGQPFRGPADAPVTIVAYSDFTCPYCRQAEFTMGQLLLKYPKTIRVTFKVLPKDDPFSLALAKYSTAAFILDEARGWEFFDKLFLDVEKFEREGESYLKSQSEALGYDFKKLKAEAGSTRVQERLDQNRKEADALGVSGTPHFLVNNLMVRGAVSKDLFEEAIEMALAQYRKQYSLPVAILLIQQGRVCNCKGFLRT
jgi:protein-disulfide isomerase